MAGWSFGALMTFRSAGPEIDVDVNGADGSEPPSARMAHHIPDLATAGSAPGGEQNDSKPEVTPISDVMLHAGQPR
jgi:hypothetical protein